MTRSSSPAHDRAREFPGMIGCFRAAPKFRIRAQPWNPCQPRNSASASTCIWPGTRRFRKPCIYQVEDETRLSQHIWWWVTRDVNKGWTLNHAAIAWNKCHFISLVILNCANSLTGLHKVEIGLGTKVQYQFSAWFSSAFCRLMHGPESISILD